MNRDSTGRLRHPAGAPKSIGGQYAPDNNRDGAVSTTQTATSAYIPQGQNQSDLEQAWTVSNTVFSKPLVAASLRDVRASAAELGLDIAEIRRENVSDDGTYFSYLLYDSDGNIIVDFDPYDEDQPPAAYELHEHLETLVNTELADYEDKVYRLDLPEPTTEERMASGQDTLQDIDLVLDALHAQKERVALDRASDTRQAYGEERARFVEIELNHHGDKFARIEDENGIEIPADELDQRFVVAVNDLAASHPDNDGARYDLEKRDLL